jgi:outer membrane receptor for ferrienterochelin and colicin
VCSEGNLWEVLKMKGATVFCMVLILMPAMVFAEDKPIVAKDVVVTATKTEVLVEDVPATITVITKEEIKAAEDSGTETQL